ncbi:hypothetical protein IG631_22822 [Alternaria alternata]|nr:hypothetical protein IG631_22822 [Alternaria alternata]
MKANLPHTDACVELALLDGGSFLGDLSRMHAGENEGSHAHWDHSRPISDVFPNAKAYFGPGTRAACQPGHMKDPSLQWDGRFFDPEHSTEEWDELQGEWRPFGPFERALDYFGDGSFWVLDAPGHMPGNMAAAARLQSGEWVMLGSDCTLRRVVFIGLR